MEREVLLAMNQDNFQVIRTQIMSEKKKTFEEITSYLKQLNPKDHDVRDPGKFPDKIVDIPEDQETGTAAKTIVVHKARLAVPFQRLISNRSAAFLCANPIKLECNPNTDRERAFLDVFQSVWDDNKLDYETMNLAQKSFSETESAELWYTEPVAPGTWDHESMQGAKFRLRMRILANSLGDTLYPIYNSIGDMVGFSREYKVKIAGENVLHFDTYTDSRIFYAVQRDQWTVTDVENIVGKIPIIYYPEDRPDWADVQDLIDRLEVVISNNADTNDYFGSPTVIAKGNVKSYAQKGEQGKMVEVESDGDIKYLTWERASDSVKDELTTLIKFIMDMTDTPNISLEEMKNVGTFSGIAMKLLFMAAHLKAASKEGTFGKGVMRRINYLKATIAKINVTYQKESRMKITPVFTYFMPKDDMETINILTTALNNSGAVMSQETAITLNPLVNDPEVEIKKMKDEGIYGTSTVE